MYQVSKSDSFFFVCFVYKVNDTLDRETPLLNDSQREESYVCLGKNVFSNIRKSNVFSYSGQSVWDTLLSIECNTENHID